MAGKFLIENENYAFLRELGLQKINAGVFDGQWSGSGEVSDFSTYMKKITI